MSDRLLKTVFLSILLAALTACGGGGTEDCAISPHPDAQKCANDLPVPCAASTACVK